MTEKDLRDAFRNIEPDDASVNKMYKNIVNHSANKRRVNIMKGFNFKRAIPALALALVMVGSLVTYKLWPDDTITGTKTGDEKLATGERAAAGDNSYDAREDMIAPYLDEFQMGNRHYYLIHEDTIARYNLPSVIDEKDIGKKIDTIKKSGNDKLVGSDVYEYIPAGGEAIVAVKQGDEYKLFRFMNFDSYLNNQDEDTIAYLALYGINKASDISKVQIIGHSDIGKLKGELDIIAEISDSDELEKFYNYYSSLKNSSDKYFEKLFDFRKDIENPDNKGNVSSPSTGGVDPVPPDYVVEPALPSDDIVEPMLPDVDVVPDPAFDLPVSDAPLYEEGNNGSYKEDVAVPPLTVDEVPADIIDTGDTGSGASEPGGVGGTDALSNSVTVRIYNQKGVYFDAEYYRNLGFISRHELTDEFRDFLEDYIK